MHKQGLLNALHDKYEAEISAAHATINIYLNSSVGIGEHPGVMEELRKQIEKLGEARDGIDTIITLQNRDKKNDLKAKKQLNS